MAVVFMTDPTTGRCVLFSEPNSTGLPNDRNAPRNAPLLNAVAYLSNVFFSSDFDYYQVSVGPVNITVTQAAVATQTQSVMLGNFYTYTLVGNRVDSDHLLTTHNLGYIPSYMVIWNNQLLLPNTILTNNGGQARVVTPYATTSQIRLYEVGMCEDVSMPSEAFTYTIVVFKQPVATGSNLLDFDPTTGRVSMGLSKFDSNLLMLRRAGQAGDSPFDIMRTPYLDVSNGRTRMIRSDGTVITQAGYNGSFSGVSTFEGAIA